MKIFTNLDNAEYIQATVIALGNFDGVHLGHRKLISEMVDYGRENNLKTLVFTFSNHPRDLLPDATKKKNILHRNEKSGIIESLGVDYLVNVPFTKEIMNMRAEEFITDILIGKLNVKGAFCGFNNRKSTRLNPVTRSSRMPSSA